MAPPLAEVTPHKGLAPSGVVVVLATPLARPQVIAVSVGPWVVKGVAGIVGMIGGDMGGGCVINDM